MYVKTQKTVQLRYLLDEMHSTYILALVPAKGSLFL